MKRAWGALLVAVAVAFCAGPVAWQIVTSVRPESELAEIGLPTSISLEAYEAVLTRHAFSRALLSSAIVAMATTALSLVISAAAAFALAKLRLRSRRTLLAGALACSMLPPIVTVSPLYLLMQLVGLRDELGGPVSSRTSASMPPGCTSSREPKERDSADGRAPTKDRRREQDERDDRDRRFGAEHLADGEAGSDSEQTDGPDEAEDRKQIAIRATAVARTKRLRARRGDPVR
ncbi:MAG: carbohydrate ABC transporter permease [Myxococcales bacterium]|nr:carbohydrate ABC transporter permease [Myxococcales bacterium]